MAYGPLQMTSPPPLAQVYLRCIWACTCSGYYLEPEFMLQGHLQEACGLLVPEHVNRNCLLAGALRKSQVS